MERDKMFMILNKNQSVLQKNSKNKEEGLKREPGFGWILDFNNDGLVSVVEMNEADQILQNEPKILPIFSNDNNNNNKEFKKQEL